MQKTTSPLRIKRRQILVIECGLVLKAKFHIMVCTKLKKENEESVGSSYYVTIIIDEEHIKEEDARNAPPKLEDDNEGSLTPMQTVYMMIKEP